MIQRIQSVYLIAAIVIQSLLFLLPLGGKVYSSKTFEVYINKICYYERNVGIKYSDPENVLLAIHSGILALLAVTFLNYKQRKTQLRFTILSGLLVGFLMVYVFYIIKNTNLEDKFIFTSLKPAFYLPLATLFFLIQAGRSILKDEKKVKESDRLR